MRARMRDGTRTAIAAVVIGAAIAGCAHRRDDRMATSATGAAPAHPQPAYGAKVERSSRTAQTQDERLRASVRERYGVPAEKRAAAAKPAPAGKSAPAAKSSPAANSAAAAKAGAARGAPSHATAADLRLAARVKRELAS